MKLNMIKNLIILLVLLWASSLGFLVPCLSAQNLSSDDKAQIIEEEWDNVFGPEPAPRPIKRPRIIVPKKAKKAVSQDTSGEPLGAEYKVIEKKVTPVIIEKRVPVKQTTITAVPEIEKETIQVKEDVLVRPLKKLPEPSALNKKISFICGGAPLAIVLRELAAEAGFKVKLDSGVNRQAPVFEKLEFIPINEAIASVLSPFGYDYRYFGKTINIVSIETRAYRIEIPSISSSFDNSISNMTASAGKESTSRAGASISLRTANPEISIWKDIKENIKSMISKEGSYTINETAGVITVKDAPKVLDTVGEYLAILNKECQKQVLVECKVVEVTLNKKFEYGIDWTVLTDLGDIQKLTIASDLASTNMTGAMFKITAEGDKWEGSGTTVRGVKALIHALETQGDVNVLSQPKQILINNQPAVIQVGDIKTYVSKVQKETSQIGDTYSVETEEVQEGVILSLLAKITDDGCIYTHISPVVTTINEIRQITFGDTVVEAPDTTSKSMNTMVKMRSGDTVVIGGLITSRSEQKKKGLPVLSWIPLIGELFKYTLDEDKRTEIVIFLTPKIINI